MSEQKLRAALEMAIRQNEHDMLLTGNELRQCREALIATEVPELTDAEINYHFCLYSEAEQVNQFTMASVRRVIAAYEAKRTGDA